MNQLQFNGLLSLWSLIPLMLLGMAGVWWFYYRESRFARAPFNWLLPSLRAAAFGLILAMLCGPTLVQEWLTGELSRVAVLIDSSASMALTESDAQDADSRFERASRWLTSRSESDLGWLDRQRTRFHLKLFSFDHSRNNDSNNDSSNDTTEIPVLWDSLLKSNEKVTRWPLRDNQVTQGDAPSTNASVGEYADGAQTALGDALSGLLRSSVPKSSSTDPSSDSRSSTSQSESAQDTSKLTAKPYSAVVVLSDGQSNSGESPSAVAERFAQASIPIFTIGYGRESEPEDLGILGVDHTKTLFETDAFQGTARIKQQLPLGETYRLEIRKGSDLVWTQSFQSDGAGQRTIEYRIAGEKLISATESKSRAKALPIDLNFSLHRDRPDASLENNSLDSSLWGVLRKNRVLVVDPRGRWEARYVKNAFQRDVAWEAESILGPDEFSKNSFPQSRDQLIGLDLVVITIDSFNAWNESQLRWLSDYVSDLGGGLILIDTGRDPPNNVVTKDDVDWLPIRYSEETAPVSITKIQLEDAGTQQRAFDFEQDPASNKQLWEAFPPPKIARRVQPAAGAETMVSGKLENDSFPLLVSRRTGLGRVVYVAHDESWRWRYNVADLYHQRFWNQLAQWTMQAPFAVENDYVALDSGDRSYAFGQDILIRARLRDADQNPLVDPKAFAIIEQDGIRVESIPLGQEAEGTGAVSAVISTLPPGRYQVRLEVQGLPNEALDLSTEFIVRPSEDVEMQVLASNRVLLEQIANATNGKYFDESQADRLNEAIESLQSGKIEQSRTLLWQSYPWFFGVMALLSIEWFLRKRAGFV